MKCPNRNCNFTSANANGLDIHIAACSRRRRRRGHNVSRRKSVSRPIPTRFGGSASRVTADNVQHYPLNDLSQEHYPSTIHQPENSAVELVAEIQASELQDATSTHEASNGLASLLVQTTSKIGEKHVTKIIDALRNERFSISDFTARFQSAADCKKHIDDQFEAKMSELGFIKRTLHDEERQTHCTYFQRNPVSILQQQISNVSINTLSINPRIDIDRKGSRCFSHPLSAELGVEAIPVVELAIKSSPSPDVFWRGHESGSQSFVGLGQIYSDKTQTSMRPNGLALYPVHVTLINHQEQERRKIISDGQSTVAFLPVEFTEDIQADTAKLKREDRMYLLQRVLKDVFQPLINAAVTGFPCSTSDNSALHCHFVLANYCCDLPEAKDILGLKYNFRSKYGCHRCYAKNSEMPDPVNAPQRTMPIVRECRDASQSILSSSVHRKRKKALECLENHSLSEYSSFLEEFPFSNIHPLLDIHNIFSYEILHNIFLGVSKLLKEMLSKRLTDEVLMTSLFNKKKEQKSFLEARPVLINGINHLLACIASENPTTGLHIDFSTPGKGYSYNGLFKKDGIIGMLEARDHKSVDQVMPFIAMFLDRWCGELKTTPVFVQYVDMVNEMLDRGLDPVWNEKRVKELELAIDKFRRAAKNLYSEYQPSQMGTPKMHLLDHVGFDIRRNGGLQYGDSSYFEHSHVSAKDHYRATSRKKSSAMDETVRNYQRNILFQSLAQTNTKAIGDAKKGARHSTFNEDVVSLVRRGKRFTYKELKETYLQVRGGGESRKSTVSVLSDDAKHLIDDVGPTASRMLIKLLKEKFCLGKSHEIMHLSIEHIVSGFVNGGFLPVAKDVINVEDDLMIRFREPQRKVSQRFVSTSSYYNRGSKHDCVLIESQSHRATRTLWAAKLLGLFRIKELDKEESECVFVQYFDVVRSTSKEMTYLGCVNLKLSVSDRDSERSGSFEGWYDIVPASSIRSVVHVVTIDHAIRHVCPESPWYDKIYHINRFYRESGEMSF